MENRENVSVVIVTYNRKNLLLECLNACLNQTADIEKIIVINNASTDGTLELLKERGLLNNSKIQIKSLEKNYGGSGGFNHGIKLASQNNVNWIWVMDDDSIPEKDALEKLIDAKQEIEAMQKERKIGFLCSQVNWTDGSPHEMNTPAIKQLVNNIPFSYFSKANSFLVNYCSFVSVLINNEAILKCGLPIKEFFIWGDDVEFTSRITEANFLGLYVPDSVIIHKTKNKKESITTCSPNMAKRYFYNARNTTFIFKKNRLFIFIWCTRFLQDLKLAMKRKDNKIKFIYNIAKGYINGLFFKPKIEH